MKDKQGFFRDAWDAVRLASSYFKHARTADKQLYQAQSMGSWRSFAFDDNAMINTRQNMALNVEWIALLCHTNSFHVAKSSDTFKLQKVLNRKDRIDIDNHYIYDLFNSENSITFYDFMYLAEYANQLIDGLPFYVELKNIGGKEIPISLTPLLPDMGELTVNRNEYGTILSYDWNGAKRITLNENQVLWYRLPNIGNSFGGGGWVNTVLRTANMDKYQKQHNLETVANQGVPAGVVKFAQKMESDKFQAALNKYNAAFRKAAREKKLFGLDDSATFEALGFSTRDLDLINGMNLTREYLHEMAGVPMLITGKTDQTTFASARVVQGLYKSGTINKSLIGWTQFLNRSFCQKYFKQDKAGRIEFAFDLSVPQDELTDNQVREIKLRTGQARPNDFLIEDGKEPSDEEAMKKYYIGGGLLPIDEASLPSIDLSMSDSAESTDGATAQKSKKDAALAGDINVSDTALNGAQISSLVDVITNVRDGILPSESARNILKVSYPTLDDQEIDSIMKPIEAAGLITPMEQPQKDQAQPTNE